MVVWDLRVNGSEGMAVCVGRRAGIRIFVLNEDRRVE